MRSPRLSLRKAWGGVWGGPGEVGQGRQGLLAHSGPARLISTLRASTQGVAGWKSCMPFKYWPCKCYAAKNYEMIRFDVLRCCGGDPRWTVEYVKCFSKKDFFFCRRGMKRTLQTWFLPQWLQITPGWYFGKGKPVLLATQNVALYYIYPPNDGD